ncbi:D-alanyl-D-alanine carboxypeptidase/D-alanyl-D-alanine endopeptidase [Saccharothrix syringae]|uniref:D-alanyl-D-alanine carboxypeptidase/D-alanyl-D-alanine-endopeptidase n=1 Tax=Saccharothrix syringae TaxID=103733 RepID=A0A5Q0H272_SACSY|nr:D-alanyl-D-alanine carboxypeptidase/D-alanyl-D-alanine-endopeptidase [Saccharothrix syringae]QFZ20213.1 D-alanyl-D-alanine carboxypeptidase/D-alanyl-D-alanine-endopeptidase [Saccharothrix syringae]
MRSRSSCLLLSLTLVLGVAAGAAAEPGDPLVADLDRLLGEPRLTSAAVGLVVRDADTGDLLYDRSGRTRFQPASTAKLLTAAAALEGLGPDHRWDTDLAATGPVRGSVLLGDLYLRGTGDPTALAGDYDALAARLAASGVRVVRGALVADDTWFDQVPLGTGWAWDDETYSYNAQTSALTFAPDTDYEPGSVVVRVSPGAEGGPARVRVEPPVEVEVRNTAVTAAGGGVRVQRAHGTNVVHVDGSIAPGAGDHVARVAVDGPTALVAGLFRRSLEAHGVVVTGGTEFRATPASARVLARHRSMPLRELLVPFLKLSNNLHAEALVKTLGRRWHGEGSWSAGLRAVASLLSGLGVDVTASRLVDGSGLSRMDAVSPEVLVALLGAARAEPWFADWYGALPVAGRPDRLEGGTLRNRMAGTAAAGNVRAKTGTLTGVSALAGYVTTADGRRLVFSLVSNNYVSAAPKDLEDAVAVRLASDRAGQGQPQARVAGADAGAVVELECSWTRSC